MRHFKTSIITILAAALLFTAGCNFDISDYVVTPAIATATPEPTATPSPSPVPKYEPNTSYADKYEEAAAARVDAAIAVAWEVVLSTKIPDSYAATEYAAPTAYRDSVDESMGNLYDTVLAKIQNLETFHYDDDAFPEVSNFYSYVLTLEDYLRADHREIFLYYDGNFTDGYGSAYFIPGTMPNYKCTEDDYDEIRDSLALFSAITDRIINNMPEGIDTYDKYRYLGIVICELTVYDKSLDTGKMPYPEYNCLVLGTCVCSGYARAFEYLCKAANLYCEYLTGNAVGGGGHAWNLVMLDGKTYYVDMTWADGKDYYGRSWRDYFCMTQEDLEYDHEPIEGLTATGEKLPDYVRMH